MGGSFSSCSTRLFGNPCKANSTKRAHECKRVITHPPKPLFLAAVCTLIRLERPTGDMMVCLLPDARYHTLEFVRSLCAVYFAGVTQETGGAARQAATHTDLSFEKVSVQPDIRDVLQTGGCGEVRLLPCWPQPTHLVHALSRSHIPTRVVGDGPSECMLMRDDGSGWRRINQ